MSQFFNLWRNVSFQRDEAGFQDPCQPQSGSCFTMIKSLIIIKILETSVNLIQAIPMLAPDLSGLLPVATSWNSRYNQDNVGLIPWIDKYGLLSSLMDWIVIEDPKSKLDLCCQSSYFISDDPKSKLDLYCQSSYFISFQSEYQIIIILVIIITVITHSFF